MSNGCEGMNLNRLMASIGRAFAVHDASAAIHIEPLARMFLDNPDKAIEQLVCTYNHALDDAYTDEKEGNMRAFIESIAGGPCETIPWALYNSLGAVYPYLERSQKDKAIREILNILDRRNYMEVNGSTSLGHTTGIREPLLLSDIKIVRHLYWPGLHDEEKLWKNKAHFSNIQDEIMDANGIFKKDKVRSDFLVAYALLRKDFTSFGADYASAANPEFLERTLQGIVAIRFAHAESSEEIESGQRRLIELLPKSVHQYIEPMRKRADWIDYKLFR